MHTVPPERDGSIKAAEWDTEMCFNTITAIAVIQVTTLLGGTEYFQPIFKILFCTLLIIEFYTVFKMSTERIGFKSFLILGRLQRAARSPVVTTMLYGRIVLFDFCCLWWMLQHSYSNGYNMILTKAILLFTHISSPLTIVIYFATFCLL